MDSLKFADQGLRESAKRESCNSQCVRVREKQQEFRGIISEVVANGTNTSDFQESSFADEIDVFCHREILV